MKNALFEMSSFYVGLSDIDGKKQKSGKGKYYLALNGDIDYVRPPHFHIYDKTRRTNDWTIEINLQRFLCTGEPFIRRIHDGQSKQNADEINQLKYRKLKNLLLIILYQKPNVSKPDYVASSRDCIEAMIRIFNKEADIVKNGSSAYKNVSEEEKFLTIIQENADKMKILPEFRKYFSPELQKKYADCFQ